MLAFDGQARGILGGEQKQFAEMADERQRGHQSQDMAREDWAQFRNQRNTRPNRANTDA